MATNDEIYVQMEKTLTLAFQSVGAKIDDLDAAEARFASIDNELANLATANAGVASAIEALYADDSSDPQYAELKQRKDKLLTAFTAARTRAQADHAAVNP